MALSKDALAYAWHGSGRRWDSALLQVLGGAIGGFIIWAWGLKVPPAILDNPAFSGVAAIAIGAVVGALVVFVLRLCWWPLHRRLAPHGGLWSFLLKVLGAQMWPVIMMTAGLFLFAILTGGGLIWLALQIRGGTGVAAAAAKTSETPNTVGNPDFFLQIPEGRYKFQWDPSKEAKFDLRLDTERNPDFGNNPTFILRNKTNTVAYNVGVTWKSEIASSVEQLTKSPKLSKFTFDVAETKLLVMAAPGSMLMPWAYYLDDSPKQTIAVIAKEAEVYFPQQLWAIAALYFINKMPSKVGESTEPFIARVTLNWETAEGKKRHEYRVRVTATNAKVTEAEMPVAEAFLNFSLEEIPN
jgi:hypothetical protein